MSKVARATHRFMRQSVAGRAERKLANLIVRAYDGAITSLKIIHGGQKMAQVELDAIDRRILAILQQNGRLSNQEIAERVNLSPSPCLRRIRRLEEIGTEEALEPRLVETIVELLERGFAPQVLLSQDVCHNSQLKANGGFGYVYLHQHFLPTLRTAAVGEGEIRAMTIDNPARILTLP